MAGPVSGNAAVGGCEGGSLDDVVIMVSVLPSAAAFSAGTAVATSTAVADGMDSMAAGGGLTLKPLNGGDERRRDAAPLSSPVSGRFAYLCESGGSRLSCNEGSRSSLIT